MQSTSSARGQDWQGRDDILHLLACSDEMHTRAALEQLLRKGRRVDARVDGMTALHVAAAHDSLGAAQLLLMYGADPNAINSEGFSVQDVAKGRTHDFIRRIAVTPVKKRRYIFRRLLPCLSVMRTTGARSPVISYTPSRRPVSWSAPEPQHQTAQPWDPLPRTSTPPRELYPSLPPADPVHPPPLLPVDLPVRPPAPLPVDPPVRLPSYQPHYEPPSAVPPPRSPPPPYTSNLTDYVTADEGDTPSAADLVAHFVGLVVTPDTAGTSMDEGNESVEPIPPDISKTVASMSTAQVAANLRSRGIPVGPFGDALVQRAMRDRLSRLLTEERTSVPSSPKRSEIRYSQALENLLVGRFDETQARRLDAEVRAEWAGGGRSFNYLLLDPRLLPTNWRDTTLKQFVQSCFYAGKGTGGRPFQHLFESLSLLAKPEPNPPVKVQRILDIWAGGHGVHQLQLAHGLRDEESLTREAAVLTAFTMPALTNIRGGDWRGRSRHWSTQNRALYGCFLIRSAYVVFLEEGLRPLRAADVERMQTQKTKDAVKGVGGGATKPATQTNRTRT